METPLSEIRITTGLLLQGALFFAVIDVILVAGLAWRIRPAVFRQLRVPVIITTAVFWWLLWFVVLNLFWEIVYRYLFPQWSRWLLPFFHAALTAFVASLAWRLSWRLRMSPVAAYCLLGGLWGILSHIWAVWLGVVDKPPMLQGASPLAAIGMAFFEFIFYWCVILIIALAGNYAWRFLITPGSALPPAGSG